MKPNYKDGDNVKLTLKYKSKQNLMITLYVFEDMYGNTFSLYTNKKYNFDYQEVVEVEAQIFRDVSYMSNTTEYIMKNFKLN